MPLKSFFISFLKSVISSRLLFVNLIHPEVGDRCTYPSPMRYPNNLAISRVSVFGKVSGCWFFEWERSNCVGSLWILPVYWILLAVARYSPCLYSLAGLAKTYPFSVVNRGCSLVTVMVLPEARLILVTVVGAFLFQKRVGFCVTIFPW